MNPLGALDAAPLAAINHLLAAAGWARARLQPFAGQVAAFEITPIVLQLEVAEDGLVRAPSGDAPAAVTVSLPLASLPYAAQGIDALFRHARISGNAEFAEAIGYVARNLKWNVEEDLSRLVGDIAAHRLASGARDFFGWQKTSATRLAEQLADYLTEENPLLLKPGSLAPFINEVDELRDAIARLEKRVERRVERQAQPRQR